MEKEAVKDYSIDKKDQKRLKGISKFMYIIVKICRVCSIIGVVCLVISMIILPIVSSNIKTIKNGESNVLKIFDNEVYYRRSKDSIELYQNNNDFAKITSEDEVNAFNLVFNYLEKNDLTKATIYIEVEFLLICVLLVIEIIMLKKVYLFFKNIHDESSPFIKDNVSLLRNIGKLLIYSFIVTIGMSLINAIAFDSAFTIKITSVIEILLVFLMAYIFDYGYRIQENSKGKIYSEDEE